MSFLPSCPQSTISLQSSRSSLLVLLFFPFDPPAVLVVLPSTYFLYNVAHALSPIRLTVLLVSSLPIVLSSIFPRFCFHPTSFPLQPFVFRRSPLFFQFLIFSPQCLDCDSAVPIVSLSNSSYSIIFSHSLHFSRSKFFSTVSCLWSCTVFLFVPILSSFPSYPGGLVLYFPCSRWRYLPTQQLSFPFFPGFS